MKKKKEDTISIQWKFKDTTLSCTDLESQYLKEQIIRNIVQQKEKDYKLRYSKKITTPNFSYIEFGYFEKGDVYIGQYITIAEIKYHNTQIGAKKWANELSNTEEEMKWTQKTLPF